MEGVFLSPALYFVVSLLAPCLHAVPPTSITVSGSDGTIPSGASIEVISDGVYDQFFCLAQGASSTSGLQLYWNLDGVDYPDNPGYPIIDNEGSFRIYSYCRINIEWILHNSILNCRIRHTELSEPLDHFATFNVKVPPSISNTNLTDSNFPSGLSPDDTTTLTQGVQHEFICTIIGTRPATQVSWFIGGEELSNNVDTDVTDNPDDPLLSDTVSKMLLTPVRENHYSEVMCLSFVVLSKEAKTFAFPVKLEVKSRPDAPMIEDPGDLQEGVQTTIVCEALNMFPAGSIHWFIETHNITEDAAETVSENPANLFDVKSQLSYLPKREDNGKELRCETRHELLAGSVYPEDVLSLSIVFCSNEFSIEGPEGIINATSATISCFASSANPANEGFVWEKRLQSGQPWITQNSTHDPVLEGSDYNGYTTSQSFNTDVLTREDAGVGYLCRNIHSSCANVNKYYYPEIYYPPSILSVSVPSNPYEERQLVNLDCNVDQNPAHDGSVFWRLDGKRIDCTNFNYPLCRLSITTNKTSAGYYRCVADNGIGEQAVSEDKPLTIHYPMVITSKSEDTFWGIDGSAVTVSCTANGNPLTYLPMFEWNGPDGYINSTYDKFTLVDTIEESDLVRGIIVTGRLTIMDFNPSSDVGPYSCTAGNAYGSDVHYINIDEATIPESPTSFEILDELTTSESLHTKWTEGANGGIPQWYLISYRKNNQGMEYGPEERVDEGISQLTINNLNYSTDYQIRIFSANDAGQNPDPKITTGFTLPSTPDERGIQLVHNPKKREVQVTGYNGKVFECLQLEISYNNVEWTIFDCLKIESEDHVIENIGDSTTSVRSRMCLNVDVELMCGGSSNAVLSGPVSVKEPNLAAIISSAAVGFVVLIVIIVIIVIVFYRQKRQGSTGKSDEYLEPEPSNVYVNDPHNRPLPNVPGGGVQGGTLNRGFQQGQTYQSQRPQSRRWEMSDISDRFLIPPDDLIIEGTLGTGHYGEVSRGRWEGRDVAVKMMKEKDGDGETENASKELLTMRENVKKELKTMIDVAAMCTNPNIVQLLGWTLISDNLCIVMEYLSEGALLDFLRLHTHQGVTIQHQRKKIPVPRELPARLTNRDLYSFAIDIARGMEYLADHDIVHRDLAARNVLLDDNLTCKVSDFGLARNVEGEGIYTIISQNKLPANWMAFESLTHHLFTTKSDVWSFGVLLWEMTSFGLKPYAEENIKGSGMLIQKLTQGFRLTPKPDCPEPMKAMMHDCWEEQPDDRPDFRQLRVRLENAVRSDTDTEESRF